ncbi:hypothetical protein J6590_063089 [Homalodisca vitripennis]|nr:hypothetical protein J6590_063089 [Homalodisca vitripennis]
MEPVLTAENLVSGGLLTGVLRVFRGSWGINVWTAQYLQEVEFSKYYGLTEPELIQTLNKLFLDNKKRLEVKSYLDENFGGYRLYMDGSDYVNMYSISSVVRYLTNESNVGNYLCYPEYLDGWKSLFRIKAVSEAVTGLLAGREVVVDLNEAFYKEHFLAIHNMIKHNELLSQYGVEWFLRYLNRFGYLTPSEENNNGTNIKFKLPNLKTRHYLLNLL